MAYSKCKGLSKKYLELQYRLAKKHAAWWMKKYGMDLK